MASKKIYELTPVYHYQRPAGYHYDDGISGMKYHEEVDKNIFCTPIFFDSTDKIFNWFLNNVGEIIPRIRVVEYIGDYLGVSDVVRIHVYGKDDESIYCTAVNKNFSIEYNKNTEHWYSSSETLKYIYEAFKEEGIVLKHDVYTENIDLKDNFEIINSGKLAKELRRGSSLKLIPSQNSEDTVLNRSLKKPIIDRPLL